MTIRIPPRPSDFHSLLLTNAGRSCLNRLFLIVNFIIPFAMISFYSKGELFLFSLFAYL